MAKKLSLLILFFIFISVINSQTVVSYEQSNEIIANPERGLQKYSITNSSYNTSNNYSSLSQSTLTNWRTGSDKVTVIFRYFLLDNFLNSDISQRYLNNIQKDFDIIRNAGLKCIVRFSYSNGQSSSPQQPVKSQILTHLNQLAPILEANKDVIFSHQAGFIGTWGEWYYTNSTEFGTDGSINSTQWSNRKDIIDAMLNATPVEIPLQVRYPDVKTTMYGSSKLNEETAYKNTPNARIGFYNDAFLNKWGDMGTFGGGENVSPVGSQKYEYLANETKYLPMTGETNGLNPPRTDGANAIYELDYTNWTTLNRDYYTQNFTNWIQSGHYNDILLGLGYRFVLQEANFNLDNNNNNLSVKIDIKNTGFARALSKKDVNLVLRNESNNESYSFTFDTDIRRWEGDFSLEQDFDLNSIPNADYSVNLKISDIDKNLASRPEYNVRFANKNTWDSSIGINKLNYSLTKSDPLTNTSIFYNLNNKEELLVSYRSDYEINIKMQNDININELSIFSISGNKVFKKENISNSNVALDLYYLKSGSYVVLLRTENNNHSIKLLLN